MWTLELWTISIALVSSWHSSARFASVSLVVTTTLAPGCYKAPLKPDHKGSSNPGFEKGSCPYGLHGYLYGWHFVLRDTVSSFVSISCTFVKAGVVNDMIQVPSDKHAYVYTPTADVLVDCTAVLRGGATDFLLSHVCSPWVVELAERVWLVMGFFSAGS